MNREEAYEILKTLVKTPNLIKHHLACEAAMKALYKRLTPLKEQTTQGEEEWGIVGLLHDADYELSRSKPERHTFILEEKIRDRLKPEMMYAIKSHNFAYTKCEPKTLMDWSIYCSDELTGLIVAAAFIHPEKKLSALSKDFIFNRFNEPSFARGANREQIKLCQPKLGIELSEFIDLVLKAMQAISKELGF